MRTLCRKLGLTVLVGVTGLGLLAEPVSADTGGDEAAFVHKLNELRASRGLRQLAVKGELVNVARAWSSRMAGAGGISHNPSVAAQAPANWVRLGENVGMGPDVQLLHDAFVASPAHYRNMVSPEFDSVGVGVVRSAEGLIFVTVNFMTQAAPVAQVAAAPAAPAAKTVCKKARKGKVVCKAVKVRRVKSRARR